MKIDENLLADCPEYDAFVEKFKPKKTTDECYTPDEVYEAVRDWAVKEYDLHEYEIVRPFYPGGDYENFDYPQNAVVLDNPPFSILSRICRFYKANKIRFSYLRRILHCFLRLRANAIMWWPGREYDIRTARW